MPFATPEDAIHAIQSEMAYAYHGQRDVKLVRKPFDLVDAKGLVSSDFNRASEVTLNRDIQDFSPFLSYINILPRTQDSGGSLMMGSQGRVMRTNNTYVGDKRQLNYPKKSVLNKYTMVKAHSDFVLHDDDIDAMSEFPDWKTQYRNAFLDSMGNDRIVVGFWGEKHALTSNQTDYPLLQDVNKGWIQLLKERVPSQVLSVDEIKIGTGDGNDYVSLDHLIQDLYQAIPLHRRKPGMKAMISESLMGFAEGAYYQYAAKTPSEKPRIQTKTVTGVYGGLDALPAPYMPQTCIIITPLRQGNVRGNLSIYWQKKSWRRSTKYYAENEQSVDWNARREAYHIEDLNAIVALDTKKIIFTDLGKDLEGKWVGEIDMIPTHHWADQ